MFLPVASGAILGNAQQLSGWTCRSRRQTLFDPLEEGQTATVTLSYAATDGNGGTVQSTFTLTVQGAADELHR